jgi:hypothetical protein
MRDMLEWEQDKPETTCDLVDKPCLQHLVSHHVSNAFSKGLLLDCPSGTLSLPDFGCRWLIQLKRYYQAFSWKLIDLIIDRMGLIIKPFDNQIKSRNASINRLTISDSQCCVKTFTNVYSQIKTNKSKANADLGF